MPVTYLAPRDPSQKAPQQKQLRYPYYPGHKSSYLELIPEEDDDISDSDIRAFARMSDMADLTFSAAAHRHTNSTDLDQMAAAKEEEVLKGTDGKAQGDFLEAPDYMAAGSGWSNPSTPGIAMSRTNSSSDINGNFDPFGGSDFPPVDRLTVFDILENLALPQRLEKIQNAVHNQAEKARRQRARLKSRVSSSKNVLVEEWRKRVQVSPEERMDKYRRRMREAVDRMGKRWNDAKTVTLKEKISFVTAVLNIFISAYMMGAVPQYFYLWYTAQLIYFMPFRIYNYRKIGYHYFLADLCYFVNLLLVLSIWGFPRSKRLLISTYCLAFGNNAVAIAMWRNSLVFHSFEKTTTLFIHIMPCATLHVLVHLIPESLQRSRFPAIHTIKYSPPDAPEHYNVWDMIIWATVPYAVWQLSYHFFITVRKRSKIAAGRPTSFTWLRRSYRGNFLGRFVLGFPESMQETVFMCIQYVYALLTMLPCPIWFWYGWASSTFMVVVFTWASWNGATFYIDAYGRRMEKELDHLRKEVARMSKSPDLTGQSPTSSPSGLVGMDNHHLDSIARTSALDLGPAASDTDVGMGSMPPGVLHRVALSEGSLDGIEDPRSRNSSGPSTPGFLKALNPGDPVPVDDAPHISGMTARDLMRANHLKKS